MLNIIQTIKPKTSTGYDNISAKLLHTCKDELVAPLVNITNKSFCSGIFPTALKLAKVYPKHKQGCTKQPSNYRPISLIPTFSKLIEKVVLVRLIDHLASNNLLTPHQHGFLAGKSTTTALISLVEFLADQLEQGNTATAILLDYSKAFDCLNHSQLLTKLTTLGVQGISQAWIKSYLTERRQIVELNSIGNGKKSQVKSLPKNIQRGVPQGSVLGPILFILFTNDFPEYIHPYSDTLMFADDTVLLLGSHDPDQLEVEAFVAVNMAVQYCHGNDLVVNEKKTKQLIFGRQKETTTRLPDTEDINSSKYLGITIDNCLSWTNHIDSLCKKLSSGLYVIRRMKNVSNLETAKTAYHALYESQLRYGITVWGGTTAGNLHRLLIHQKRAIRILGNLQPRQSCKEVFKELKILTVVNLYIEATVTYIVTKSPDTARTGSHHNYNTRNASDFCLPVHHLTSTERTPSYMGAKLWNTLPEELKKAERKHFRSRLKSWLLEHPFYSLTEYFSWTI